MHLRHYILRNDRKDDIFCEYQGVAHPSRCFYAQVIENGGLGLLGLKKTKREERSLTTLQALARLDQVRHRHGDHSGLLLLRVHVLNQPP